VVGVNHSTTPIAFREKLAISAGQLGDALISLRRYVRHGVILSTCNRTEVYAMDSEGHSAKQASIDFLKAQTNISEADLQLYIYVHKDKEAIEHLFRVASGLDSMIIGEFEILGQAGRALETAEKMRMVHLPLRNLFRNAIRIARRVRTETLISRNALSISSVAVDLATRIVGNLGSCRILVIGAGEAGRLVAKAAKERGAHQIAVISRSEERASALAAALGGRAVALGNLRDELAASDILISCTGAPHTVLGVDFTDETMRARPERPLAIIDIAVPRDVEPGVERISGVFLYNIDDLIEVSDSNRGQREEEIGRAQLIIDAEVEKFCFWWTTLEVRPTVSALTRKAEEIRRRQLNMTVGKLTGLSDEERDALDAMTRAIVKKILHEPIQCIKKNADKSEGYNQLIRELFRLDGEKPE